MLDGLLRVGVITSPHGIKGEVKVYPTTDDPQKFKRLKSVILYNGKEEKTVDITGVKFFKQFVIVKLKQCNSMNEAELLRKQELYITKEQSGTCGEDENFVADLIGLRVVTDEGEVLGRLTDVMETGNAGPYHGWTAGLKTCSGMKMKGPQAYAAGMRLYELSCVDAFSGDDSGWMQYQHHRPGRGERTSVRGGHQYPGLYDE